MNKNYNYDSFLNIDTSGYEEWTNSVREYHPYQSTSYQNLIQILDMMNINANDCIVDFGCGKGRVSFFLNYKTKCRSVGIEFSSSLFASCIKNLEIYVGNSDNIVFLNMLAQEYNISNEDNIFYFFNPFSAKIFEQVLNNIIESFFKSPRNMKLILYYPQIDYIDTINRNSFFELYMEIKLDTFNLNNDERILIYEFIQW